MRGFVSIKKNTGKASIQNGMLLMADGYDIVGWGSGGDVISCRR